MPWQCCFSFCNQQQNDPAPANDRKYDDEDEVASFQMDLDKDAQPTEIFSVDFKKKLKVLYDRDWKKIED